LIFLFSPKKNLSKDPVSPFLYNLKIRLLFNKTSSDFTEGGYLQRSKKKLQEEFKKESFLLTKWSNLKLNKKILFIIIWYFILWGVTSWTLFEYLYPHSGWSTRHGNTPGVFFVIFSISFLLLLTTGGPLIYFIRKKEIHKKEMVSILSFLLIGSIILTIQLVPQSYVCAEQKSNLNWYIEDLKSQGFEVYYTPVSFSGMINPNTNSYSEFVQSSKGINASAVTIYGGGQSYFIFFLNSRVSILANVGEGKYFLYSFYLDMALPV